MNFRGKNKNLKFNTGLGLVEVLIALLIVAVTMVMVMEILADAYRVSKENDIQDQASSIMARGLEFGQLDLPDQVDQNINSGNAFYISYRLDKDGTTDSHIKVVKNDTNVTSSLSDPEINSCDEYSDYYLSEYTDMIVCNQIIFTNLDMNYSKTNQLSDAIRITSVVVYYVDGEIQIQRAHTYRKV